ncbi:sel1 repeat family protein [Nannocystis pusilla]|uniref:Sel1 repeat family protein n=1 Tax=Nannocystis pusilla TaxID=889268 RepID=A0ABS7TML6_9BACT|nr:sel1 repeat family protein [Nannocystis pusilla]
MLSAVFMAGGGCGAGTVGKAVRPTEPTAGEALGAVEVSCREGASDAQPLVVDMTSSERVDLEVAMKEGVAIVAYDCKSMRLLPACKLAGTYKFAGVSRKEEVVKLNDQGEIAANLPFNGVKIAGGVDRGAALDLALVLIGKQSTTISSAGKPELTGRCDGATHFVRSASVGAFAVDVGTRGEARLVADVFGYGANAKSASQRQSLNKDGELGECRAATPDDLKPPAQCRSAVRLELVPISADAPPVVDDSKPPPPPEPTPLAETCPAGMSMAGGKCTADTAVPFVCAPKDEAQCEAQCQNGSAGSCHNLGSIIEARQLERGADGSFVQTAQARNDKLNKLYTTACDGGVAEGCDRLGYIRMALQAPRAEQLDAWQRACQLGHGPACRTLAEEVLRSTSPDLARGRGLLDRGCKLGDPFSCASLAGSFLKPRSGAAPTPDEVAQGVVVLKDACDVKRPFACRQLANLYSDGKLVARDEAAGLSYYEKSCETGDTLSCLNAGLMVFAGRGATKDAARAEALFERTCPSTDAGLSCADLAKAFREGKVVPRDVRRAASYMERMCTAKGIGCTEVADMYLAGKDVPKDRDRALKMYDDMCTKGGGQSCMKLADEITRTDKARAKELYGKECGGGLIEACDKFKKLGGDPATVKRP